jgi:hypothetical protein
LQSLGAAAAWVKETQMGSRTKKQGALPTRWSVKETNDAVQALKDALMGVGVLFPSLDREHSSLESPLVDLGRCRPDVAVALADCLVELVELRAKDGKAKEGADAGV